MAVKVIDNRDVGYLDRVLLEDGWMRAVPAAELADVPDDDLLVWLVRNGVYQVPTRELVEWLREQIGARSALEVCAGRGHLCRLLGIRGTDSHLHLRPDVMLAYAAAGQTPCVPGKHVERMDANEAVKHHRPQVVVGSWVTSRWREGMRKGNDYGPEDDRFMDVAEVYIHIGNLAVHVEKPLLAEPHETFRFPWLRSRGFDQAKNRIWVWRR